jgi:hypothetical protein
MLAEEHKNCRIASARAILLHNPASFSIKA